MCSLTTNKTAELNDRLRQKGDPSIGHVMLTSGFSSLHPAIQANALAQMRSFTDFTEDDDPWGEHDFGALEIEGTKIFWKIAYYDRAAFFSGKEHGSENPEDGDKTWRVLTVMLAEEY